MASPITLARALRAALAHPIRATTAILRAVRGSENLRTLVKTVAVIPRALAGASAGERLGAKAVHSHWLTSPSSAGLICATYLRVPHLITAHRWDIGHPQLLETKISTSVGIRCISSDGLQELARLGPRGRYKKFFLLHMGVNVPENVARQNGNEKRSFTIAMPANMVEKKGHRYLIEAANLLKGKVQNLRIWLFSDGPLRSELEHLTVQLGLQDIVAFRGYVSGRDLKEHYESGDVDVVVLPSIVLENGEREGIPVSLMEAMSHGIPVISTNTGGTGELIGNGAGLEIPQRDSAALAEAILCLAQDAPLRKKIGSEGRRRVETSFDGRAIAQEIHGVLVGSLAELAT